MNRIYNGERRATDVGSRHFASSNIVRSTLHNKLMKGLLIDLRDQELRKIRALLHDEAAPATQAAGDELDQARRDEALEFHVSLLNLSERRLAAITSALVRLDDGHFGICQECKEQISLTRLKSVPSAPYCFDCQKEMEAASCRVRSRILPYARPTNLFDPDQPEFEHVGRAADSTEGSSVPPLRRRQP
ncbi:MAG: TraR/DksA family transcriptional regulator [Candidatus Binatus sp.]|uniref:TraR/DksA family transcriptional regulator n=1 Tax=Candidatus Binatus sp. TaxID=2811406 RepID=UPI003C7328CE